MPSESSGTRDALARDRTHMANERTLLAYLRTAIMLMATGGTLWKLAGPSRIMHIGGVAFLLLSILVAVFGTWRFQQMRVRLRSELME